MNAFWDQWRKQLDMVSVPAGGRRTTLARTLEDSFGPDLQAEIRRLLEPVARPCAQLELAGGATSATQSYLSGHPYLPAGRSWPEGLFGPQIFVGQINFAEVPPIAGFPTCGLLQWFVEAEESFGLGPGYGETGGFTVRWFAEPSQPSVAEPDDLTPTEAIDQVPMEFVGATALDFTPALSLPEWGELPEPIRTAAVWERLGSALGRGHGCAELVYSADVRQDPSPLTDLISTSKIGGYPTFSRTDPRRTDRADRAATLLVELDSRDTGGWGDGGIAHLFGDPAALGAGDTTSVRYHWGQR